MSQNLHGIFLGEDSHELVQTLQVNLCRASDHGCKPNILGRLLKMWTSQPSPLAIIIYKV